MKYKVGDKVRVVERIAGFSPGGVVGTVGTVTDVNPTALFAYAVANEDRTWYYPESALEPYIEKTYEEGLADAWKLAKKIAGFIGDGGYSMEELRNIFDDSKIAAIFRNHTYEDCRDRIEAYEKRRTELQVGDVVKVEATGYTGVVIRREYDDEYPKASVLFGDGIVRIYTLQKLIKTGESVDMESMFQKLDKNGGDYGER